VVTNIVTNAPRALVELHSHTLASGHAFNTIDEMVTAACGAGLQAIAITDHGPSMQGAPPPGYFVMGHRLPATVEGVRLLFGCEANVLDTHGRIDLPTEIAAELDVLLVGLHEKTPYPLDGGITANTRALIAALENPHVHAISHPFRSRLPIDVQAVARAAAAAGKALEVNLYLFDRLSRRDSVEGNPEVTMTRRLLEVLLECDGHFIVGTDAHHQAELETLGSRSNEICGWLGVDPSTALNRDIAATRPLIPALRH